MSNATREKMSRVAQLAAAMARAHAHQVYKQLNKWTTRVLDSPDDREPTCDICKDDEDMTMPPVLYLRHRDCGRSCHLFCILEYLKVENFCLCPYCRVCLKDHDTPDLCVLWEDRLQLWRQNLATSGGESSDAEELNIEEEPRIFTIGLEENMLAADARIDLYDCEIDVVGWVCEKVYMDRDYPSSHQGTADRVFNEINALSLSSHRLGSARIPAEILQLVINSRASRSAWLIEWNTFIDRLQISSHEAVSLDNNEALYEYCDSITIAFMALRAREGLVDLLYRWKLLWLREDWLSVRRGVLTDVMLARRRFLFVPGFERGGHLIAGSREAALQHLEATESSIIRRWKQTREAIVDD